MKLFLYLFLLIHVLIAPCIVFPQSTKVSISKEPAWVTINNYNYNKTSLDKDATDGYIDVIYETQVSLADQSEYIRRSKKIISQAGVQNGSEISVSFDPSYQQLTFHSINIFRNRETLNKLVLSKIKTLQQEKELTNFIYNGRLNSVLILEDVRQGDIIEYSFTIKGFNPIFKNRYTNVLSLNFTVPLYEIYHKLIVPAGRKLNFKNLNEKLQPDISSVNDRQVYEWKKNNVEPLVIQDYTPTWYNPYSEVMISEYNSWKEVNDWAMELFPINKELSPALQKKIKDIETTYTSNEERIKTALKFVQDDIRYMGIEMGVNSHKPADPSKVFAQRFGDCKEKSYLLCCMLRTMHIEADPVLINTVSKKSLRDLLPAPTNFDHMTVRVKLDDDYYWFDPTISYQRGDIKNIFYPDYQAGLVIASGSNSLTDIRFRNKGYMHLKEFIKVGSMSGKGTLMVTTNYFGNEADIVRNDFNSTSISELMKTYQKFYTQYYDNIKADSLTYADDDNTGIFVTKEYYTLPDFWTVDKDKVSSFTFTPFSINNILRRPKEKERKMPFELPFPTKYKEELIIDLPDNWSVTEDELNLKNACYAYNSKFYCIANRVYLETDYENYKNHVSIEEANAYFKDLEKYDDVASFEISSGKKDFEVSKGSKISNWNLISIFVVVGIIFVGFIWWSRRT